MMNLFAVSGHLNCSKCSQIYVQEMTEQTVSKMMNLFAVSGHLNYSNCSRIYAQEMTELSETNAWLQKKFEDGKHAVWRSGRYWSGL